MVHVARVFRQIEPAPSTEEEREARPFEAFAHHPALVLLGDPGMGKSTEWAHQTAASGGLCRTVRNFLALPERPSRGPLFIDALDERRQRSTRDADAIDELVTALNTVDRPPFRLSSRETGWQTDIDLARLARVSPDGQVVVIRLEPLDEAGATACLTQHGVNNPASFIHEAQRRGLQDYLANPELLRLLATAVSGGEWPRTRIDLFERAAKVMAAEIDPVRKRAQPATDRVLDAAEYLCAVLLLSGRAGIDPEQPDDEGDFLSIPALAPSPRRPGSPDLEELRTAAASKLFRGSGEGAGRVVPVHRTTAEFLAARHLVKALRDGTPLARLTTLLTGADGGVFSQLRSLFAWVASLAPDDAAAALMQRDPYGVLIYGDVRNWPPSRKTRLLDALKAFEEQDPWYLAGIWAREPLGALATADMEEDLLRRLDDPTTSATHRGLVLTALAYGEPMPGLGPVLIRLIRDESRGEWERDEAADAYAQCTGDLASLRAVLDDIIKGRLSGQGRLRDTLLCTLYPAAIGVAELPNYYSPRKLGEQMPSFWWRRVWEGTPSDQLPEMLDAFVDASAFKGDADDRFERELLYRILLAHGDLVSPDRLFRWLGRGRKRRFRFLSVDDYAKGIRAWLEGRPELCLRLIEVGLAELDTAELAWYNVWDRLIWAGRPDGYARPVLAEWLRDAESDRAVALYRMALQAASDPESGVTINDLFPVPTLPDRLAEVWEQQKLCPLPAWQSEEAQRNSQQTAAKQAELDRLNASLTSIRSGEDFKNLCMFATELYDSMSESSWDPLTILSEEFTPEIAAAALDGMKAVLLSPALPSAEQELAAYRRRKRNRIGYVVLCGTRLIEASEVENLPERTLRFALTFDELHGYGGAAPWKTHLARVKPGLVIDVINQAWDTMRQRSPSDYARHVDCFNAQEMPSVALPLLLPRLYTAHEYGARDLLSLLLKVAPLLPREVILQILRGTDVSRLPAEALRHWQVAMLVLDPTEDAAALVEADARTDKEHAWEILESAQRLFAELQDFPDGGEAAYRLIRILAPIFPPAPIPIGISRGSRNPYDGAQGIQGFVSLLAQQHNPETGQRLASLLTVPELSAWHDHVKHNLAQHARSLRDAAFQPPEPGQVADLIANGPPASREDLQALVLEVLAGLQDMVRHSDSDYWTAFWHDAEKSARRRKSENEMRNSLMPVLRERLQRFGIHVSREASAADYKREDLRLSVNGWRLPVECKGEWEDDLWTAPANQLLKRYANDVQAGGLGIYLVFWTGEMRMPAPPDGSARPTTPMALAEALRNRLDPATAGGLRIVVLDVSPMESVIDREARTSRKAVKARKAPRSRTPNT